MDKQKNHKKTIISITATTLSIFLLLFWVSLAYYSLNKIVADDRLIPSQPKFIAHRGYSELYMENTISAYNAAASSDFFHGIETDIWQTKDGIFVCSHNSNPFVDKNIDITSSNYDDIKALPLDISSVIHDIDKTQNYYICTLKDYLQACRVSSKYALIEVKQEFSSRQIEELLAFVKDKIFYKNVFWGSFHKKNIELIYKNAPYYKVMLFTNIPIYSRIYATLGYNIGVNYHAIKPSAVSKAHKNNSYVFVYTLSTVQQLEKYIAMDVDFIICDGILG